MLRLIKNIGLHTLAIILGMLVDAIIYTIAGYLLIDLIGSIPLIANLISYPVDYSWYALVTVFSASAFSGIYVCYKICSISKTKYNYGLAIYGIIYIIDFISRMVESFSEYGFSFSGLIMFLIIISIYLFGSIHYLFVGD